MAPEKQLEEIAQQYRDEGYVVLVHPGKDNLPEFAGYFGIDLLATRGEERVLVQVMRDRSELEAAPNVPPRAEITNTQPGWRYDLVIQHESDPLRRITRDAREPSEEEINAGLADVERLIAAGDLRAACVLAWSALEAAMRRVAGDVELYLPRSEGRELLRVLYGNGILSRDAFTQLNRSYRLRTEIVHGLIPPAMDADMIQATVHATRHLLSGSLQTESVG